MSRSPPRFAGATRHSPDRTVVRPTRTRMAASSRLMIPEAERRFPVRIKLAVPSSSLGERLDQIHAWLDENCGANGWAMTPSGLRGVVNDAVAIYFLDPTTAAGFVPRWCAGSKFETAEGAFRVREDAPGQLAALSWP